MNFYFNYKFILRLFCNVINYLFSIVYLKRFSLFVILCLHVFEDVIAKIIKD